MILGFVAYYARTIEAGSFGILNAQSHSQFQIHGQRIN